MECGVLKMKSATQIVCLQEHSKAFVTFRFIGKIPFAIYFYNVNYFKHTEP